jgi:hypothetical protein
MVDHVFGVFSHGIANAGRSGGVPEHGRQRLQFLPHIANCRSGLRVFGNAEGVLAGKAKGLKLLNEIVSELD